MKKIVKSILEICLITLCSVACGSNSSNDSVAASSQTVSGEEKNNSADKESSKENSSETEKNEEYFDKLFLSELSEALQARWALGRSTEKDAEYNFDKELAFDEQLVNAELEKLEDCRDKKFEDNTLQEYAISYYNGLSNQKNVITKASAGEIDEDTFYEEWSKATSKRLEQIYLIYSNYELKIDSKYIDELNQIFNIVYLDKYGRKLFLTELNDFSDDAVTVETGDDGFDIIKIMRTNPTEYEFKDLNVYLYVWDSMSTEDYSDDVISENVVYSVGDWKPGEEIQLVFKRNKAASEQDILELSVH